MRYCVNKVLVHDNGQSRQLIDSSDNGHMHTRSD